MTTLNMGSDSQNDVVDEKHVHSHVEKVSNQEVDTAAQLVAGMHIILYHFNHKFSHRSQVTLN
jgi:hypothetical protein